MTLRALLLLPLLLAGCARDTLLQEEGYVFGTRVEVSIYGEKPERASTAIKDILQEFQRLHDMLHAWKPSELSTLNAAIAHGKKVTVSPELAQILTDARQSSIQSGDLFNPAIGGMVKLWGFHADDFKPALPDAAKLAALVTARPSMQDLIISTSATQPAINSRNKHIQLDLGGYAKGYALDRAASLLKARGIHHALINIGGNILALGTHGSRPWRVGIQHPRKPGPLATLDLLDGEAIGTSGDYQRYFELDGKRYCHLIDPRSGQPALDVQAVTVLTQGIHAGVLSDVASKPLFIAGAAGWRKQAEATKLDHALLVDGQGTVHLTAAMRKRLEFTDRTTALSVE